jgi:TolA-binding protein
MPAKKLTKSDLEEDRFVEWILETADFVRDRMRVFAGGLVAVAAVALIVVLVLRSQEESKLRAAGLLGDVMIAETNGQYDEGVRLCEQLVKEYAGTPAAGQGVVLLGNRYFAQARYVDAQHQYDAYLDSYGDQEVLVYAAWSGLAACFEAQGDFEKAAGKYQEYATTHAGRMPAALALLEAARCYRLAGDGGRQKATLERIVKEYADSPAAAKALEAIALL